jgi:hypothetical protein
MSVEIMEFERLIGFLEEVLPDYFLEGGARRRNIVVAEGYNGDLIASFLITYDQFSMGVPKAIQEFLRELSLPWKVIGSFDISDPISPKGEITSSPCFEVSSKTISGSVDMELLLKRWGTRLLSGES